MISFAIVLFIILVIHNGARLYPSPNIIGGPCKYTQKNNHDCKQETIYEQIGIVQLKEIHQDYRTNY